ncbi:MAG: GNAT family N-acetyltransferase [Woeseiaceae bacterium]|nr:GNAT family N-acetyltransferase [Woeseiaceae bacterium]
MTNGWQLETRRLFLRRVTADDTGLMLSVWNDPAFIEYVGDRGIRTEAEAIEELEAGAFRLYRTWSYGPYKMVRKEDAAQIGICGLFKRENLDDPDIGFAVLPDYCGQGYAAEAASAVVAHARDDLHVRNLLAIVSPGNTASIGLIEKLGLTFSGMITMPGDDEAIRLYEMRLEWNS